MSKIVSVVFIFIQSAFLACCNGCTQSPAPSYNEDFEKEASQELVVDTVSEIKQVNEEKEMFQKTSKVKVNGEPEWLTIY